MNLIILLCIPLVPAIIVTILRGHFIVYRKVTRFLYQRDKI